MAHHQDRFRIAMPSSFKQSPKSDYSYRRCPITKTFWITHNGNDMMKLETMKEVNDMLERLRKNETY